MSAAAGRLAARLVEGTRFYADDVEPIIKNLDDEQVEALEGSVRSMDDAELEQILRRVEDRSAVERILSNAARVGADQTSRSVGTLAEAAKGTAIGVTGLGAGGAAVWAYSDYKEAAEKADTRQEIAGIIEQIRNDDSLTEAQKQAAIEQVEEQFDDDGVGGFLGDVGYFGKFAALVALYFIGKAAVASMEGS